MESPKTPESPNQYFNMADFLQGEISLKNVENLQRLTLYTFKSMFLVLNFFISMFKPPF